MQAELDLPNWEKLWMNVILPDTVYIAVHHIWSQDNIPNQTNKERLPRTLVFGPWILSLSEVNAMLYWTFQSHISPPSAELK